jgi:two-component system OmpR family response regulator
MFNVLMVEDDQQIADLLIRFFDDSDFDISHVILPSQALSMIERYHFDVIILDLTLPEMDGLELCKKISKLSTAPIIISSARSDINDKLNALEYGAEDYLAKPYDPRELQARIRTLLKREGKISYESNTSFIVDNQSGTIKYNKKPLELTPAEYEMLKLFIDNPGTTLSRADIANAMDSHRFESGVDSINVIIGRIRKKIETLSPNSSYIKTIRGLGYRFDYQK